MKTLLSPKELALAIGVSESTLKRWADEGLVHVSRTPGGHRRIPLHEALRFVRQAQAAIVRPDILELPELTAAAPDTWAGRSLDDAIFAALEQGDSPRSRGLILSAYLSGRSLADLCDGPIRAALRRLGELWQHGPAGIAIEHRATDVCVQALNQIRSLIPPAPPQAPKALGGAPYNDPYILPSLMAATVLADQGLCDRNLGPLTPLEALLAAVREHQPALVWLTCSTVDPPPPAAQDILALADELAARNCPLALGGRAVPALGLPPHPNVRRLESMSDLAAFARRPH